MIHEDISRKLVSEPPLIAPEVIRAPNGMEVLRRFDVTGGLSRELGPNWRGDLFDISRQNGTPMRRDLSDESALRMQNLGFTSFELRGTPGDVLFQRSPGLGKLYQHDFFAAMRSTMDAEGLESVALDVNYERHAIGSGTI